MTHDVVICGAGPAGSVVAQRLAAAGLRVALVGGAARPGWEGLSSRSRGLLMEEGVDSRGDVIAGPWVRRGAWANGRSVEGVEWLVERARLANVLSACARERGADYRAGTASGAMRAGDCWRVALRGGEVLRAPMVVDARGRSARGSWALSSRREAHPLQRNESPDPESPREGLRRSGPVLLAIGQEFRRRGEGAWGTGIGVTDLGWCWWAERGDALWVQIIGKPRSLRPAVWAAAAAAQIPALARVLEGACAVGAPVARAAHAQLGDAHRAGGVRFGDENRSLVRAAHAKDGGARADDGAEPTFWPAGDAAMALDPLSGQGVYEAVRGARLVATAIQSVWAGGDARVAQRFVAERREEAWLHGVSVAAGFYRENESRGGFWSETAAAYEALLTERAAIDGLSAEGGPASKGESRANALRRPARAGAAWIERRPVLDEGRIVEREVVVSAEHPRGVWQVAGVPLAALRAHLEAVEHANVDAVEHTGVDAVEHTVVEAAAVALDRTPGAVASAMNWLRERGPLSQRGLPRVSSGG